MVPAASVVRTSTAVSGVRRAVFAVQRHLSTAWVCREAAARRTRQEAIGRILARLVAPAVGGHEGRVPRRGQGARLGGRGTLDPIGTRIAHAARVE